MTIRFLTVLLTLFSAAHSGASTLYKCTDNSGVVLYTNQKITQKKCIVLSVQVPPPPAKSAASAGNAVPPAPTSSVATATPANFPRVSGNEQRARDGDRRAILDRELAAEQANRDRARQALAVAATKPEIQKSLQDTIALHERNIEALNKELTRVR